MSDISTLLEFDWRNGIIFIALIVVVAVFAIQKFDWIVERFGFKSRRQQAEERQNKDIEELRSHAQKTDSNIDKILGCVEQLKESIHSISKQVDDMQAKNDEAERSKLKDRIAQSYRYHKARGYWSSMDKEAFDDLIKAYENAGGKNSFVHSICVPQSLLWKIVEEEEKV